MRKESFLEESDEEETETIYPVDIDSDAETIAGEHYNSVNSSAVISFKTKAAKICDRNPDGRVLGNFDSECDNDESFAVKKVSEMTPGELMEANPALKAWMEKMMSKNKNPSSKGNNKQKAQQSGKTHNVTAGTSSKSNVDPNQRTGNAGKNPVSTNTTPVVVNKSPSDTTIYAPALKLVSPKNSIVAKLLNQQSQQVTVNDGRESGDGRQEDNANESILGRISQFLDQVRNEQDRGNSSQRLVDIEVDQPQPSTSRALQEENAQ